MIDSAGVMLCALDLRGGASFEYAFALGDDWRLLARSSGSTSIAGRTTVLGLTLRSDLGLGLGSGLVWAASAKASSEGLAPSGRNVAVDMGFSFVVLADRCANRPGASLSAPRLTDSTALTPRD